MKKQLAYIILIIIAVVQIQIFINDNLHDENKLIEAFNVTDCQPIGSQISTWGLYSKDYLNKDKKQELLKQIADTIGLKEPYEIKELENEMKLVKKSKSANSVIKISTIENEIENNVNSVENYVIVDLSLSDNIESVLVYKNLLEDVLVNMGIDPNTNITMEGTIEGKISLDERKNLTNKIITVLQANKRDEFISGDIYNIYAYTPLINVFA